MHCVLNFEQPLLLWDVIAGLRARAGRAEVGCGPAGPQNGLEIAGRAENFRPVHISSVNTETEKNDTKYFGLKTELNRIETEKSKPTQSQ